MKQKGTPEVVDNPKSIRARKRQHDASVARTVYHFPALRQCASLHDLRVGQKAVFVSPYIQPKPRPPGRRKEHTYIGAPIRLIQSSNEEINALVKYKSEKLKSAPRARSKQQEVHRVNPKASALHKVRTVVESKLTSPRNLLDLRPFEGEPMSPKQFRVALKTQLGVSLEAPELAALVEHIDTNKDGYLDFSEISFQFLNPEKLEIYRTQSVQNVERLQKAVDKLYEGLEKLELPKNKLRAHLHQVFQEFDDNGDDFINQEELMVLFSLEFGVRLSEEELVQIFAFFDPNGDGRLKFSEFSHAILNKVDFEAALHTATEEKSRSRLLPPFLP